MENLTKKELELIIYSLNQLFNYSNKKLESGCLGDLERKAVEKTKFESKELITKLNS